MSKRATIGGSNYTTWLIVAQRVQKWSKTIRSHTISHWNHGGPRWKNYSKRKNNPQSLSQTSCRTTRNESLGKVARRKGLEEDQINQNNLGYQQLNPFEKRLRLLRQNQIWVKNWCSTPQIHIYIVWYLRVCVCVRVCVCM